MPISNFSHQQPQLLWSFGSRVAWAAIPGTRGAAFVSPCWGRNCWYSAGVFSENVGESRKKLAIVLCSGEDDKALDFRVPFFSDKPSADEVGLPLDQKIPYTTMDGWWLKTTNIQSFRGLNFWPKPSIPTFCLPTVNLFQSTFPFGMSQMSEESNVRSIQNLLENHGDLQLHRWLVPSKKKVT